MGGCARGEVDVVEREMDVVEVKVGVVEVVWV